MQDELAKHVATIAFRSMSHLTRLLPMLKKHCEPDEYDKYRNAITLVAARISTEVLSPLYGSHPGLQDEIDKKIERYGKII